MPSIAEIQNEIVDEFSMLDRWEDKYEYIIDLGKKLSPMPTDHKTEQTKIKACQSQVWIYPRTDEAGRMQLEGASDSTIVNGLVALVLRILSGQRPMDIASADLNFAGRIGMDRHLAPTRSNGLAAMIKQVKLDATVLAALANKPQQA